jgi:hypothetical protein
LVNATKLNFTRLDFINLKANNASTHPQFVLDFGQIGIGGISSNLSNAFKCVNICTKPGPKAACDDCRKSQFEEAWLNPSTAHLYHGCNRLSP